MSRTTRDRDPLRRVRRLAPLVLLLPLLAACAESGRTPGEAPPAAEPGAATEPAAAPDAPAAALPDLGLSVDATEVDARTTAAILERFGDRDDVVLLDVRTEGEVRQGHVEGAEWLDFRAPGFADEVARLDRDRAYLVFCRTGNRSGQATRRMRELGFPAAWNVAGGITAWRAAGLPEVKGDATPAPLGPEGRAAE